MSIKKFLKRTALFILLPLFILGITEAFVLPPNFFTYRTWEAIIYKNPIPHLGSFYPGMHIKMDEQGDLAYRTQFAIVKRNVQWDIDALGFRNNEFVQDPDLLLIGDSFTAGITLSQDETITNRLQVLLGKKMKVYNMAPSSFGNFVFLNRNSFIKKPKLLIFSMVERNLPTVLTPAEEEGSTKLKYSRSASKALDFRKVNCVIDRLLAFNTLKWAAAKVNGTNIGHQSPFYDSLFFMQGQGV